MNNPLNFTVNGTTEAEAKAIVSQLGWLSRTPERFRDIVLRKSQLMNFGTGETLYSASDPAGGMYGLVSGGLSVSIETNDLFPVTVHLYVPGTWTGDVAAISGQPRLVGVTTTRATQILHLPLAAVNSILVEEPEAYRSFARLSHWHVSTALGAVSDLMIRDSAKRLIALLLRLSGCRRETVSGFGVIEIDLSQDDLAIMSNVGRTKANAILRELQAAGQIEISYRRIRVLAPDALRSRLSR